MEGEELLRAAEDRLSALQIREALALFRKAEAEGCDADVCAAGRWTCHMLAGNFEAAWQESDAIGARGNPDPNRFWDGTPIDGKSVLIRCLHGLGDTLQFVRYAPLVRRRARSLTIEAQPTLKAFLAQAGIADQVITWGEREPFWNQQIEIIELPRIFRTTLESIPDDVPYLDVSEGDDSRAERGRNGRLRAGLVWASSSYNPARSAPLHLVAPAVTMPGVELFSLQAGEERACLASWGGGRIIDAYEESGCVLATAKTLKKLDLVITVDTMMAHLAGAMARPVWTLLPFECDWRWMLEREDSPWYPTMRLFRQPRPGDWATVIRRVRRELENELARRDLHQAGPEPAGGRSAGPGTEKKNEEPTPS